MKFSRILDLPWRKLSMLGLFLYFGYVALSLQRILPVPFYIDIGLGRARLYALCVFLSLFVGIFYFWRLKRRNHQLEKLDLWNLALWIIVPGLIGARLLHVIEYLPVYLMDITLVVGFWIGGLNVIGGMIGGVLGAYLYTKRNKLDWNFLLRQLILIWPMLHIIGRAGNYFDRTLYGIPSDLPWSMFVDPEFRYVGLTHFEYYHPLFLYEQILNLGIFLLLGILAKRGKSTATLFKLYVLIYLTGRFLLDFLRIEPRFIPGLTFTQLVILGLFMFGLLFGWLWQISWKLKYKQWWVPTSK